MKLIHKIIKLVFSLCVIFLGQSVFGQREIQPYEDSFTYEYALKYYSNLPVREFFPEYFFLENFKAPKGVKIIEDSFNIKLDNYYMRSTPMGAKDIHIFNSENGFMQKTLRYYTRDIKNNEAPNPELLKEFTYIFDSNTIKINVVMSYDKSSTEYIFDNKTEHLTHIIKNYKDTVFFTYSKVDAFELETYRDNDSIHFHKSSISHGRTTNLNFFANKLIKKETNKHELYIKSEFENGYYDKMHFKIYLLFSSDKRLQYFGSIMHRRLSSDLMTHDTKDFWRKRGFFDGKDSNMSLKRKKNKSFSLIYNFEKNDNFKPFQRGIIRFKQNNIYYKDYRKKFKPATPEIIYKHN